MELDHIRDAVKRNSSKLDSHIEITRKRDKRVRQKLKKHNDRLNKVDETIVIDKLYMVSKFEEKTNPYHNNFEKDIKKYVKEEVLSFQDKEEGRKFRRQLSALLSFLHKHRRISSAIGIGGAIAYYGFGYSLVDIMYGIWVGFKVVYGLV